MAVIQEVKGQKTITLPAEVCRVKGWVKGMRLFVSLNPKTKEVCLVDGFDATIEVKKGKKVIVK